MFSSNNFFADVLRYASLHVGNELINTVEKQLNCLTCSKKKRFSLYNARKARFATSSATIAADVLKRLIKCHSLI